MHVDIQPFAEYAVAPYMGAWIETLRQVSINESERTSHPTWVRGLKHVKTNVKTLSCKSHPTWVRGLKQSAYWQAKNQEMSHPTWVRGLKLYNSGICKSNQRSHPTWVRGLKQTMSTNIIILCSRTLHGCVD